MKFKRWKKWVAFTGGGGRFFILWGWQCTNLFINVVVQKSFTLVLLGSKALQGLSIIKVSLLNGFVNWKEIKRQEKKVWHPYSASNLSHIAVWGVAWHLSSGLFLDLPESFWLWTKGWEPEKDLFLCFIDLLERRVLILHLADDSVLVVNQFHQPLLQLDFGVHLFWQTTG